MKNTGTEYMSTERTPTVRPDFAELLPPLSDEQLSILEADILKNGCYAPVIVNEDMVIVDGHNRASICEKHGVPYRMAVFSFEDDLEAKQWALHTQKSRRNLSINELCKIALKLRPEVEARAKEKMAKVMAENRQLNPNNANEQISTPVSKSVPETLDTRKELAKTVGVGEVTMGRAMKIEDEAPQPVKDAVDSGKLTIAQGYTLTKELQELDLPDEEKEQAAMEAVERDIDHKELTDPFVQLMLERFNSYAEYSVSGGGIHIYGKCDIDRVPTYLDKDGKLRLDKAFYMKNPHNSTELYCGGITNRFAVYTGNVIHNVPLKECTDALLITLDKDMRRK